MRYSYFFLFLLFFGCSAKKKQFKAIRDTIYVSDTVFIAKVDSVIVHREETMQRDEKETNDSIIIIKTRDTIIISKYGNQKEIVQRDEKIESMQRVINELSLRFKEVYKGKEVVDTPKEKPKNKRNIWKYISIFEAGIIAILILLRVRIS